MPTEDSAQPTMMVIAIDGPAASGKSSVSRMLSEKIHYAHIDTGAMYRGVTWRLLDLGVDTSDSDIIVAALGDLNLECSLLEGKLSMRIDGLDPRPHIKDDQVNAAVSSVACVPAIREHLVTKQRQLSELGNLVMEGRDIGSVVFPDTPYKFYIDADPKVRAQRRRAEGSAETIGDRDRKDSTRSTAPLTVADDARVVDTTYLTLEGVVGELIGRLRLKGLDVNL